MKIVSASVYTVKIPFRESFRHSLAERNCSDTVVVELVADSGVSGFGEGVPRRYVTGETLETCVSGIMAIIEAGIFKQEFKDDFFENGSAAGLFSEPSCFMDGVVANSAGCAAETALMDCLLRCRNFSAGVLFPAKTGVIAYSGVVGAGSPAQIESSLDRCRLAGFSQVKIKVGSLADIANIRLAREMLGDKVSIRLDANAAFDFETAVKFLSAAAEYGVECVEQPVPRGDPAELAKLRSATPVPIMADESLVTLDDARELIETRAVDYFNIRISKCGGLCDSVLMAKLAEDAGIGIQAGCHVGESAVLSAVGRCFAAHVSNVSFVEGSYGEYLLEEDLGTEPVTFGHGGLAPVLTGAGFGVEIRKDTLEKYSTGKKLVKV